MQRPQFSGCVSPVPPTTGTRSPSFYMSNASSVWSGPTAPENTFPPGYAESVFRLFDYRKRDEIYVDDLSSVLRALGYDPDTTLATALSLMSPEGDEERDCNSEMGSFASGGRPPRDSPGSQLSPEIASDLFHSEPTNSDHLMTTSNVISLHRFIDGLGSLQSMRSTIGGGAKDDLVATGFRLFDIQRRGVVSVEDMLAVGSLEACGRGIPAEVAKEVVLQLKSSTHIKGLTLKDFRWYLGSGLNMVL